MFQAGHYDATLRTSLLRQLVGIRKEKSVSQQAIAEQLGTTQSAISELERGQIDPRLSTLQGYARVVGMVVQVRLCADTRVAVTPPMDSEAGPIQTPVLRLASAAQRESSPREAMQLEPSRLTVLGRA